MGGNDGGDANPTHDRGAAEPADTTDDPESWPGLESLPPSPPHEYPPARPFRRRRRPDIELGGVPPAPVDPLAPAVDAEPPPSRRRWPLVAAVVAAVLLLLVVPAVLVAGRSEDEPDQALGTTTTTTSSTTTTTAPPDSTTTTSTTSTTLLPPIAPVDDPPLDAAIAEGSAFVIQQRGFEPGAPVPAVRLPAAEFEARVREREARNRRAIEAEESMLKLQGIIPEDADYVEQYLATFPTLVGAYYDRDTKGIVARGEPGSPVPEEVKVLLAHELTHAFDDRAFDLFRTFDDPYSEQAFGLATLSEGDAQRIQNLWANAHGQPESHPSSSDELDVVAARFAVTYELGEILVDDIVARGGEAELNASFLDPPMTSEQIMHPEKYAVREPALPLEAPVPDGAPLWEGVTGEYGTGQTLGSAVPPAYADQAAAGWGADKGVIWMQSEAEGGLTCLRIAYTADTPEDLVELEDAFAFWVAAAPNRTGVRDAPDRLLVTSCTDVPPPPPDYGGGGSPA